MVLPNCDSDDLSTDLEVLDQLGLVRTIVHILHKHAALVRVVRRSILSRLACVLIGATSRNFTVFFLACKKKVGQINDDGCCRSRNTRAQNAGC